jgi:hypothetical protein
LGKHRLVPHPHWPPNAVASVTVEFACDGSEAELRFMVEGGELSLPEWTSPGRADDLWQSTCFELFLRPASAEHYFEFNFSPSTQWAAYRFDSYREGRQDLLQTVDPKVFRDAELSAEDGHVLEAAVDIWEFPPASLRLGLCAIIEEMDGTKSYWALAHPPGDKPDFHDPACFALELPAAKPA